MWQWLCFEQYNLEPNIGTARFWIASLGKTEAELGEKLVEKRRNGHAALAVLEQGLAGREFLVGDRYSLADIALYAYTHVAPEGGFSLDATTPRSAPGAPGSRRSPGTSRSRHGAPPHIPTIILFHNRPQLPTSPSTLPSLATSTVGGRRLLP